MTKISATARRRNHNGFIIFIIKLIKFVHNTFFHHQQNFSSNYDDFENGIERDIHGSIIETIPHQDLNDAQDSIQLTKPKKRQNEILEKLSGLKAEDPIPTNRNW
ncbi:320_t:CDS:2 [Paraglomus occultum]|uniref:320_t:CDS:1 n=1 Tax=Paraglomus occultum TaxID=144539 RepID=A0A9N9BV48_9GLOM|nr:320_t:CDS:2 [Paraglomus occultum]